MEKKRVYSIKKIVFFITAILLSFLSMSSIGLAKPIDDNLVNITIPSKIEIYQDSRGQITYNDFVIENDSPLDFSIYNINANPNNNWNLVDDQKLIVQDSKNIELSIDKNIIYAGDNKINIPIKAIGQNKIPIDVNLALFTKSIEEQALDITFKYKINPTEFTIELESPKGEVFAPIKALNGDTVALPKPNILPMEFGGWKDLYTGKIYNDTITMPVGGTKLVAIYEPVVMDIEKFKALPFVRAGFGDYHPLTGLEFKTGIDVPEGRRTYDISKKGDGSVIAYRHADHYNDPRHNDIIVAANASTLHLDGSLEYIFFCIEYNRGSKASPLKYFRSDGLKLHVMNGSIARLFQGCYNITDISGLKYLDTSNITNTMCTFYINESLEDVSPIKYWDTSKLENMTFMFVDTKIKDPECVKYWDVSNLKSAEGAFKNTHYMHNIDLRNWNIPNNCNIRDMFYGNHYRKSYAYNDEIAYRLNREGRIASENTFVGKHYINFDSDGGTPFESIETFYTLQEDLPTPIKEGYTFKHWEDENKNVYVDKIDIQQKDYNLRAIWEKNQPPIPNS